MSSLIPTRKLVCYPPNIIKVEQTRAMNRKSRCSNTVAASLTACICTLRIVKQVRAICLRHRHSGRVVSILAL
jgi:hypothetical protein